MQVVGRLRSFFGLCKSFQVVTRFSRYVQIVPCFNTKNGILSDNLIAIVRDNTCFHRREFKKFEIDTLTIAWIKKSLTHYPLTPPDKPSVCVTSSLLSFPPLTSILTSFRLEVPLN